jgi:predicted RNase H-like HicB family nuclease
MIITRSQTPMIFIERTADGFMALFPRNDYLMIRSTGDSRLEALRNLRESLETYLVVAERDAEKLSEAINQVDLTLDQEAQEASEA